MKRILLSFCCFSLILLSGCSRPTFQGTDLTGANFGGDFQLMAHTGKPSQLSDFKGKVVALFFGYTHCPDVCPTTMAELKTTMQQLGDKASEVQVLFVTVDPERDTQQMLQHYVPAFDNRFIGLTGTLSQIEKVAEQYKVVVQKQGNGTDYTVDHSAGTYLLDRDGRLRVLVNYGAGPQALANDLSQLINE